jgi:hypothetical protein
MERTHHDPFTADNCEGYADAEMTALNAEFTQRWNGWQVDETQLFRYANGALMTEEDAIRIFQDEVARR